MKRNTIHIFLAILSLFYLSACASSKKSSKDNWLSRGYHNVTARDNGYFNAKLLMQQNEKMQWDGQKDNFTELLPVFKYGDQQSVQSMAPSYDEIIKKSSIAIQLHPKSHWVDDSYLLIGKSNFYKGAYDESLKTFQYVVSKYSDPKKKKSKHGKKKKKKKEDTGEKKFFDNFKHQPSYHDASLWIVRTYIEQKKYTDAQTALSVIKGQKNFPEELYAELYAVEADLYLKQKQYESAIIPIELAIENIKDKALKARYNFILAQLHQQKGENPEAIESLKKVIALKPDYITDFYARLAIAKISMDNYGFSDANTLKTLQEMATSEKYKEFYSLLYYSLAEIELARKDKEQAIEYLNLSVRNGDSDPEQKALSYMKLGDIYYQDVNYIVSYNYYDSCLITLPKTNDRFNQTVDRRDGLGELVKYLKIIETEKRLQYLASLNEWDLETELDKMLAEQDEKNQTQQFLESEDGQTKTETSGSSGDFYFYNALLKSKGYTEFKRVWGTRKLEDDWRRGDKTSTDEFATEKTEGDNTEENTVDLNSEKITREEIIASIPNTEKKLQASNEKIAMALYNAGGVYKQRFNQLTEARANFKENVEQYPDNTFELQALYQLYIIETVSAQKDAYKNKILEKYPESLFANIIRDPDYLSKQMNKNALVEEYYTTTLNLYNEGSYSTVAARLAAVDSLFKENPYKPKFDMLNALIIATTGDKDAFVEALNNIVATYPTDEVGIKAKEILLGLGYSEKVVQDVEITDPNTVYVFNGAEEHYFIGVINVAGKAATTLKNNLSAFNSKNYALKNLRLSSLLLGKEKTLILVKSFPESTSAMEYYSNVKKNEDELLTNVDSEGIIFMVIAKSNYIQFYKSKDVGAYQLFFNENYLENK